MGKANRLHKQGLSKDINLTPKQIFNYRVKVFIPGLYFEVYDTQELMSVLKDAMAGLEIDAHKIEDVPEKDGSYIYMFKAHSFPFVKSGEETPDGTLWLCASEGWKLEWQRNEKGMILVPEYDSKIHMIGEG